MLILAVVTAEKREQFRRALTFSCMQAVVVSSAAELEQHTRNGEVYQVALLPASLTKGEDWWRMWGDLVMLSPKPAILVYAQAATFQLWSGVLEVGGYDVIVVPLTDEKLRKAVLGAAASVSKRFLDGTELE